MIRSPVGAWFSAIVFTLTVAHPAGQGRRPDVPRDVQPLLAAGLYDRAESVASTEIDAMRASRGDDSLELAMASDILVRALILNGHATQERTLTLARRTLDIKERYLGTEDPRLVPSLLNLGDAFAAAARFDEALAVLRRAVMLCEKNADCSRADFAEALDHLGGTLTTVRQYDDALRALERSRDLKAQVPDQNGVGLARTLAALGSVLQSMGLYERAGPPIRQATAIHEAENIEHPAYAETLNLVAQQLYFEGHLVESRDVSERAVAVAERTLRPDHPIVALSIRLLGSTLEDLGDLAQSMALKERALAIAVRNFGPDNLETSSYLYSVAYASLVLGDFVTARDRFQRALGILEAHYGPWHDYVAIALSQLARANARLGDFAIARRELLRAVAIHERVGGPNHPYVANALMDLASVYRDAGSPGRALPLLKRALAIRETSLGPDHRDVAWTLSDLALTLMQLGELAQAQTTATRAVRIWERLDIPDAPDYANVLALYAELHQRRGEHAMAREYYGQAMAIRAKVFGASNPEYADVQAGLALALASLGDRESAVRNAASAEAIGRAHLRTMLRSLPERQSLNYAVVRPKALDLILSLSDLRAEFAGTAMDGLIRGRALVLDEMATRHRLQRAAVENTDPLRTAYASAQQQLANLAVRGPGPLSPAQYTDLMEAARRKSELAEQALAERSAEFKVEQTRAQLGLDDVRASLPSDSALVSFVRYNRTLFTRRGTSRTGDPIVSSRNIVSYVALVTRSHQPPVVVPLGAAETIESRVSRWRADIAAEAGITPGETSDGSNRSSRDSGSALRQLIWDRLVPHLGDASRVFVVPDGVLNLVPFAALPVGQRSYLLERGPLLHYLSAERDLVPIATPDAVGRGLLALGGPAYDDASLFAAKQNGIAAKAAPSASARPIARSAGSGCEDVQAIRFSTLKGTLQEVREVSGLWSAGPTAGETSRVLVGRDANESVLKQEAHRYRVLHFATHGFFLGDPCSPPRSGTRAVGGLVSASNAGRIAPKAENPLLLSGLALAGANRRQVAALDEDDGILTAEEVASLDFGGVEWAVLSACNTGLGEIRSGEGVLGLRRAFQVAGTRTVIMSLWPVEDEATRIWMRALYEGRLTRNLDTAAAMREASLGVLRARRAAGKSTAPFFWAAFVAAGDWR